MKKIVSIVITLALTATASVYADAAAGEHIYKKKGCSSCHHPTKDQLAMGMGPSYQQVSAKYKAAGGKAALVNFLAGKGKPIVAPAKFSTMKGQLRTTKKLSDAQRGDLADFILSH